MSGKKWSTGDRQLFSSTCLTKRGPAAITFCPPESRQSKIGQKLPDRTSVPGTSVDKRYLEQCHKSPCDPNRQMALVMVLIVGRKREPTLNQYLAMIAECP
jgi:hypothetical protein